MYEVESRLLLSSFMAWLEYNPQSTTLKKIEFELKKKSSRICFFRIKIKTRPAASVFKKKWPEKQVNTTSEF